MISIMNSWLRSMIAGAFLVTLLLAIVPEGKSTAALRFLTGVLMTLLLVLPLARTEPGHMNRLDLNRVSISELEENAKAKAEKVYSAFIRRETEEYIWSAAEELGIKTLGVSLTLDTNAVYPCPREVSLRGVYTAEQQAALSALLESDLGVLPVHQYWSNANAD